MEQWRHIGRQYREKTRGRDYFADLTAVHDALHLAARVGATVAFPSLVSAADTGEPPSPTPVSTKPLMFVLYEQSVPTLPLGGQLFHGAPVFNRLYASFKGKNIKVSPSPGQTATHDRS